MNFLITIVVLSFLGTAYGVIRVLRDETVVQSFGKSMP